MAYRPPALSPAGQPLASFGDRLLAVLIDSATLSAIGLVLSLPAVVIFFVVVGPDLFATNPDGTLVDPDPFAFIGPFLLLELALVVAMVALTYVFHVEMMFKTGQTLGKRTMKLRIVPLDPSRTLNRGMAVRRFLLTLLPGVSYVDGLWQLWDKPYQQCLHDKVAGTVVVKVGQ